MKRGTRVLLAIGLIAVVIIAWVIVLSARSNDDIQFELLEQAREYMEDGIYILAVPLLEEAATYNAAYLPEVEYELKKAYLQLIDQRGFRRNYISLLESQMNRNDAPYEVFLEAANFYLADSRFKEAYTVLKDGIAKTGNSELITLYESTRYEYRIGYDWYDDVTAMFGANIGVSRDGLWGIARATVSLMIPCEYEKVSTFGAGRAFVYKDKEIYAVDNRNNRVALFKAGEGETATDFGNFANDRIPIKVDDKWYRVTGEAVRGSTAFEWIGMYSEGYAAAQLDGRWGVVDRSSEWIIPCEYDGIVMDELGRAYGQNAAFVRQGSSVYLFVNGEQVGDGFDDALPFGSEGFAAVKMNGLWGFIDTTGELKIPYQFEDALSFGQHLAAVKVGDFWGYISLHGHVVIEPIFLGAKSFSNGSAPVLTESGWRFITLTEYADGGSLL